MPPRLCLKRLHFYNRHFHKKEDPPCIALPVPHELPLTISDDRHDPGSVCILIKYFKLFVSGSIRRHWIYECARANTELDRFILQRSTCSCFARMTYHLVLHPIAALWILPCTLKIGNMFVYNFSDIDQYWWLVLP